MESSQQSDVTKLQAKSTAAAEAAAAAPYSSALRSVQKPSPKPWKKPEQSRATKVYNVNPRDFRDLVQQLTGAPSPSTGDVAQRSVASSSPHANAALMHGGISYGYSAPANSAMHVETSKAPVGFMDIFATSTALPAWWQLQSP